MNKLCETLKILIVFAIGAVLGIISIIIPPLFIVDVRIFKSPLFPMVRTGIEGASLWTLLFLFLSGIFLGIIHPKREKHYGVFLGLIYSKREILWGISTMSLLPILAFIEMSISPTSHNLWPIEFVMHGFMTIPGIIGAYTGAFVRRKFL